MRPTKRQRSDDRSDRMQAAEAAAETLGAREDRVNRQLNLAGRLAEGWRKVHKRNHLAQIFHEQGGI